MCNKKHKYTNYIILTLRPALSFVIAVVKMVHTHTPLL